MRIAVYRGLPDSHLLHSSSGLESGRHVWSFHGLYSGLVLSPPSRFPTQGPVALCHPPILPTQPICHVVFLSPLEMEAFLVCVVLLHPSPTTESLLRDTENRWYGVNGRECPEVIDPFAKPCLQ